MRPVVLILLVLVAASSATLSKKSNKNGDKSSKLAKTFSSLSNIGLLYAELNVDTLVKNAHLNSPASSVKHFGGATLAYVTPWNSLGYDIAKNMTHKFTHISPVWLQLSPAEGTTCEVKGKHDIDKGWIKDVRAGNKMVKIVPRVLVEGWTGGQYGSLLQSETELHACVEVLMAVVKKYRFDGFILELPHQLAAMYPRGVYSFVAHVYTHLHEMDAELILVLPPPYRWSFTDWSQPPADLSAPVLAPSIVQQLSEVTDFFSLMTYDFAGGYSAPNAPLAWVKQAVETYDPDSAFRDKILVGLNFYGYRCHPQRGCEAVLGRDLIATIKQYKLSVEYDTAAGEHRFSYPAAEGAAVTIWFPTPRSLQDHIAVIRELGTGISIWEIGQGLNVFYELL